MGFSCNGLYGSYGTTGKEPPEIAKEKNVPQKLSMGNVPLKKNRNKNF
jgi:hypothetical protein